MIGSSIPDFIKQNPGLPFIASFIGLLATAVSLLTFDPSLATRLSTYAFYSLLIGTVLQIAIIMARGK